MSEYDRLADMKQQIEWAMKACEAKGCFCQSYQWLRAYRRDIESLRPPRERKRLNSGGGIYRAGVKVAG